MPTNKRAASRRDADEDRGKVQERGPAAPSGGKQPASRTPGSDNAAERHPEWQGGKARS